jgi:hypothetical protein
MCRKGAGVVGGFPRRRRFGGHFDIATEGEQANLIEGFAVFEPEQAGSKSYGKGLHAYAEKLRNRKVT